MRRAVSLGGRGLIWHHRWLALCTHAADGFRVSRSIFFYYSRILRTAMLIDDTTSYVQNEKILAVDIDGAMVVLSPESGMYYEVSGIGRFVWDELFEPKKASDMVVRVCEMFDVDEQLAAIDLNAFLDQMCKAEVIRSIGSA